jgi:hypothetical protein
MEKKEKQGEEGRGQGDAGRGRVVRQPITAEERAELMKNKPKRSCCDCMFCVSSLFLWARTLLSGFPVTGMCANHLDTPGQLREVPGRPCRNFRAKPRLEGVVPPLPPNSNARYIPLTRRLHALVDQEDYEWLMRYQWHASPNSRTGTFYARRHHRGHTILMHRLIVQAPKGTVVDHINGNGLDNRRCNLRLCTRQQNARNRRPQAKAGSRFLGVYPHGTRWMAKVGRHYLGLFDDEVEAAQARDRKALELFGEYAWLNFPPESPEGERQQTPVSDRSEGV